MWKFRSVRVLCFLFCQKFLFLVNSLLDNVARCLSMVFNVIFTYFLLGKSTSMYACGTLVIIIIGFILGINGEINFSLFGTAAGVLSSVFVSLNSIYTSKILPKVDNDKSQLLFYNNFNASLLFLPFIFYFEHGVGSLSSFVCLL
jgi:GDP-fucose transporter C1